MKKSPFDLTVQNSDTEGKIIASLERISQAFRVLLWDESKDLALTPIQVQVLIFLLFHDAEKCTVSYLADEFNMSRPTISDTVKTLERKQLIEKEYEQEDNRSYLIRLTKKGKEFAHKTSTFASQIQTPVAKLGSKEKENLLLSLLEIIHHLNKAGIITVQRMCFTCEHLAFRGNDNHHFCTLLNQKLKVKDLRVDCPEHQLKE
jgi:DNA-binding MarR family transcriptional regulator